MPIIQPIDDWNNARKLGLLFEAQVEKGKMMFCAIDIQNDLETRPVARQLRYSLLSYMSSEIFNPQIRLSEDELLGLVR
jgi:beta-galactosidase